jgi:cation diffusion facilitator CzcD-associated flavoprotein CzcO
MMVPFRVSKMCSQVHQALKRRVAVIGAGPAGAIATDALAREQIFEKIRVFDRRPVAGGTW